MNPSLWLGFLVLEVTLSLTPGPAVLTVASQGVRHGWRRAGYGALGIGVANLVYFGLSAAGLGAFLAASPRLLLALRACGLLYLAWTAVKLLGASAGTFALSPSTGSSTVPRSEDRRARALFAQAVATQLSNPKAILFFAAFLAPFLDPAAPWPVAGQIGVYALTTFVTETPILVGYALAAERGSRWLPEGARGQWQDRIAGACLLCAVAWLGLRG
ncbi:MAG: LysE family translocator [Anaeromyxobacteraceae bacterium]